MDKNSLNERYGRNITKLRLAKKMSQVDFIDKTEYSKTTIQKIEDGRGGITTENILRISEILEVEPYELLVDRKNVSENIYSRLQKLSSRDREMILKLVEFMEHNGGQAINNETDDQAD